MIALMALLSGRQKLFADKMSKMLIRESDNKDSVFTSEDTELSSTNDGNLELINSHAKRMVQSKNNIDGRLVEIYRLHKSAQLKTIQQQMDDNKVVLDRSSVK